MSKWSFDQAHSEIGFSVRHMMFAKVRGSFGKWSGEAEIPDGNLAGASASVAIEASSVDTRNEQRDGHLRSGDFFDAEKFPTITFASRKVEPVKGALVRVTGDLTIHGVTREVAFDVEQTFEGKDPWGNTKRGFRAEAKISRKEFGLVWNQALEAGGVLVSDEVDLYGEFQLQPAK